MNDQARTQGGCPGTVAAASIAPSTITPIVNGLSTARRAMTPAQTIAPNPLSKCLDFWGTVHPGRAGVKNNRLRPPSTREPFTLDWSSCLVVR